MSLPSRSPARAQCSRGFHFALVGLLIGFLGLGIAAYRMSVESEVLSPPKKKEISDVVSDTIKKTADKLMGEKDKQETAPEWLSPRNMGLAASACGSSVSCLAVCPG
jgi:hypothetical protein